MNFQLYTQELYSSVGKTVNEMTMARVKLLFSHKVTWYEELGKI